MNAYIKFKSLSIALFFFISLFSTSVLTAQETGTVLENRTTAADDELSEDGITGKDITRWSILGGTAPVIFLFGLKTWDWGNRHSPKTEKEGWFGEDTSFGGSDKAGHFLAHYMVQRAVYNIFDWTENGEDQKWAYSIGTTMTVGLLIEVGDAYTSAYGFSYEDLIVDYAGILIGAALDYSPMLDGFIGFSIGYVPSPGYRSGYEKGELIKYSLDIVNDYSGMQYIMNLKPAGFRNLGFHVPFALRILSVDIGWYTKGYTHYDTGRYDSKERDIFVGISINSAQLLSEIWAEEHRNTAYTIAHTALEYYSLPYDRIPVPTRYTKDLNK